MPQLWTLEVYSNSVWLIELKTIICEVRVDELAIYDGLGVQMGIL